MSFSKGGQKTTQNATQSGTQTGTSMIDPQSQEWQKRIMEAAQAAGGAGPSPLTTGASDYYSGVMKAGNMGLGAMSGDANAVAGLMNPYTKEVIDANSAQWDKTNQRTMNAVNDRATAAGAFGGSRHGIATGTALAENNMAQAGQTAGLLRGGYDEAMARAAQLAQGGYAGAGANANLGMGGIGSPDQWMLQALKQGWLGPMGQTNTGSYAGQSGGAQTTFGGSASTPNIFKMFT